MEYPKTARIQCANSHASHGYFDVDSTGDDTFIVREMNGAPIVTIRLDREGTNGGYMVITPGDGVAVA